MGMFKKLEISYMCIVVEYLKNCTDTTEINVVVGGSREVPGETHDHLQVTGRSLRASMFNH